MNVFLVYWHAEPQSFNHAMLETAENTLREAGHSVQVSDLYAMDFQASSTRSNFTTVADAGFFKQQAEESHATEAGGFAPEIDAEMAKMEWCDLMIMQFPLWWFGLPGVMKGWVDRVFAMGRIYGGGKIYETGTMQGKRAMLALTTGGLAPIYEPDGFNGDIDGILRPIHRGILQFVGFDVLAPEIVYGPARIGDEERRAALARYAERLRAIDSEAPIEVGRY